MPRPTTFEVILAGTVSYEEGLALQLQLEEQRIRGDIVDTVVVLEHPPVITLGHRGDASNVVASVEALRDMGIALHRTSRGGDVTYHGPGQVVMYPIVDLHAARMGQAAFVEALEETMIRTIGDFGVEARRIPKKRGVFVGDNKIGAVGIHVSHGVTTHGLALNVAPDLSHYETIVPCGLHEHGVTSLTKVVSEDIRIKQEEVEVSLVQHFANILGREVGSTSIGR